MRKSCSLLVSIICLSLGAPASGEEPEAIPHHGPVSTGGAGPTPAPKAGEATTYRGTQ